MEPKHAITAGRLALMGSLTLHGLVGFALWTAQGTQLPPLTSQRPVEIDVRWVEKERPPEPVVPPAPVVQPPRRVQAPSRPAGPTSTQPSAPQRHEPVSDAPTVAAQGEIVVPRGSLTPSANLVMRLPLPEGDGPRGTTTRNDPSELPDPVAMAEYTGEKLSRKLNLDVQADLAKAMNGAGAVKPFFRSLENAMRTGFKKENVLKSDRPVGDVMRDAAKVLTPGDMLTGDKGAATANKMMDTGLGRSLTNQAVPLSNIEDQRFRESAMQLMSVSAAVQEHVRAARLRTVLDITFDATGGIADASISEKSGDPVFDESVLHLSRKVARGLPESDDKGLGSSWWRSKWQFTWEPPDVRIKLLEAWPVATPGH